MASESNCAAPSGIRINKCFKERFSRREADRLIEQGRVTVNDQVVTAAGFRVQPTDLVRLDGIHVHWQAMADLDESCKRSQGSSAPRLVYLKYWKPRGVVCTTDLGDERNIVSQLGEGLDVPRVFPVGRLDMQSTGLILLTNDGRLVNRALRSRHGHRKEYLVTSDRRVGDEELEAMRRGVVIRTVAQRDRVRKPLVEKTKECLVERLGERELRVVLQEGRNRQIRKMLGTLGYTARSIHRIAFMGIGIEGLEEGEWKKLNGSEMRIVEKCLAESGDPQTPPRVIAAVGQAAEDQEDAEGFC